MTPDEFGDEPLSWIEVYARPTTPGGTSWCQVWRVATPERTSTPVRLRVGDDNRYLTGLDASDLATALLQAEAISKNPTRCTGFDSDHRAGGMTCGFCLVAVECSNCGDRFNPNVDRRDGLCPHCNAPMRAVR